MSNSANEVSLRNQKPQAWYHAIVLLTVLPLAGCIASKPGSGGGQQTRIQVTVSPSTQPPVSVPVSTSTPSTQQFTATVTGTSNTAVTWSLSLAPNQVAGCTNSGMGTAGLGSFVTTGSDSMTYTAPTSLSASPCGIAITATASDNTTTGQALASVHVVVTISPSGAQNIGQSANLQFTASVAGTTNQAVNWFPVSQTPNVGSGMFDPAPANSGLYVAPDLGTATSATATITAVSQFDSLQQSPATTMNIAVSDPLGTVVSYSNVSPCPNNGGLTSGNPTCFQINTSCPGVADMSAYIKVNTPAGTPLGTVIFGTGSGGSTLYDSDPDFTDMSINFNGGLFVVQGVFNAGFNTVQISFGSPFNTATPNGWLQGPGGVRRLACRYATVADWIYKNPTIINPLNTSATNSAPMCATGNSGGSGALAYAVTDYGLGSEFAMIEPTSGPVMTSLNKGCNACNQFNGPSATLCPSKLTPTDMCYSLADAAIIDSAYQTAGSTTPQLCTAGVNGDNINYNRFLSDSILSTPTPKTIPLHGTNVSMVFGGTDTTNAIPQGQTWRVSAAPANPAPGSNNPPYTCPASAPHAIPFDPAGAQQIVNDIVGNAAQNIVGLCK